MWQKLRIADRVDVADGIRSYDLRSLNGDPLPPFTAGAHVQVQLAEGGIVRRYSLADDPVRRDRYRIAVLREDAGLGGSRTIHETWNVGDLVVVSTPENHFPLADEHDEALLVAGGIGITPILSMTSEFVRRGVPLRVIYVARTPASAAFADELAALLPADRVLLALTGRRSQGFDLEVEIGAHRPGRHIYVCGPPELLAAVRNATKGWPTDCVHFESFAVAPTVIAGRDEPFEVELASTGIVYRVDVDESILGVLERHKIKAPALCREGYCGTCIVGVLSGIPDHRDTVLSEQEQAANTEIAICCSRSRTSRLVIDL